MGNRPMSKKAYADLPPAVKQARKEAWARIQRELEANLAAAAARQNSR